ncbi:MAG: hypothetical protein OXF09_08955 [Hyphomicrobiales bacterium]|nr:hypothetical protein [Hyphomicrobiales bacterium]
MSKETEKLTPEEVMQALQDHEVHCERRQKGIVDQFTQTKEHLAKIDGQIEDVKGQIAGVDGQFARVDGQFAEVKEQFTRVDGQFAKVDSQFAEVKEQFTRVDGQFARVDGQFAEVKEHLTRLETKIDRSVKEISNWLLIGSAVMALSVMGAGFLVSIANLL